MFTYMKCLTLIYVPYMQYMLPYIFAHICWHTCCNVCNLYAQYRPQYMSMTSFAMEFLDSFWVTHDDTASDEWESMEVLCCARSSLTCMIQSILQTDRQKQIQCLVSYNIQATMPPYRVYLPWVSASSCNPIVVLYPQRIGISSDAGIYHS